MEAYEPIAHARALRWASRQMATVLEVVAKEANPDPLQATGSFIARVILMAFATEVALNALGQKETREPPNSVHDLHLLFDALSDETQQRLDLRFQGIRAMRGPRRDTAKTIAQVLDEHRDDFERWRYLYEDPEGSSVELLDLDPAFEAILQEYASRFAMAAHGEVNECS